jgi:hypothetical protein
MLALLVPAGCQTGASSGEVPKAAVDACLHNADAYQNAAPGTAKLQGSPRADVADDNPAAAGNNWALQIAVSGVMMVCTVTPTGTVVELKPL